jgi:tetratricopeptide (TPR) repeat protein
LAVGPLVNRNNAGGYLNLCLAGAMAILLWSMGRVRGERPWLWELRISAIVGASLIAGGVLCTLSRGAVVAMVVGMVLLAVPWIGHRTTRFMWSGLTVVAGVALVAWVGRLDAVCGRLATLTGLGRADNMRLVNWAAGLRAASDFWRCGSGLGSYGYIYRLYERPTVSGWCDHAENQPLQALVDGGVVGLLLLVAAVVLVGVAAWRMHRGSGDARSVAFGWGVLFGLLSQSIHGLTDFGLMIPSNAVLFALMCGAVAGGAMELRSWGQAAGRLAAAWAPRLAGAVAVLVVLTACTWGWAETCRSASVGVALRRANREVTTEKTSPERLRNRLDELTAALANCKDHAEGQWRASQLWSDLYRVHLFAQLRSASDASVKDQELWAATLLLGVHGQAYLSALGMSGESMEQWRDQAIYRDYLVPALRCALAARSGCPLLLDPRLAIAQLCGLVTSPQHDKVELERARRMAPENAELLYWTGLLELQAGRPERACRDWRRLLELSEAVPSPRAKTALGIATSGLPAWQVIERMLPDRPALMVRVAEQWYAGADQADARRAIADRIIEVVDRPGCDGGEQAYYRGAACELRGAKAEAIRHYGRAVELNPWAEKWRYRLAVLLHSEGRNDEALEQARRGAQQSPGKAEYRTLLQSIHHARLTAKAS